MNKIDDPNVASTFQSYPEEIRRKLFFLRELIFEVASEHPNIEALEETLKWGEPSYLADGGSTVRVGWRKSTPQQYAIYFNCNTRLVDTFRELYSGILNFESNRAIVFNQDERVPAEPLKHCIELSLRYHAIKHLPLLGT